MDVARIAILPVLLLTLATSVAARDIDVPMIGCKSDGQSGPQPVPKSGVIPLAVDPNAAARLAYYITSEQMGVLAPRGWHCLELYGSNGASLYVTPGMLSGNATLGTKWNGIEGDGVQFSESSAETSGRFEAARIAARTFPELKQFVRSVIAEGLEPASNFSFGAYQSDRMHRPRKYLVEYQTPAHKNGVGTMSRLKPNADSITGAVVMEGEVEDNNFVVAHLAVRLSAPLNSLSNAILQQMERDNSPGPRP